MVAAIYAVCFTPCSPKPLRAGNLYLGVSAGGDPEKQVSAVICVRSGFTHTVRLKLYELENRNRNTAIFATGLSNNYTPEPAQTRTCGPVSNPDLSKTRSRPKPGPAHIPWG